MAPNRRFTPPSKPKDFKSAIKSLFKYTKPLIKYIIPALIFAIISSSITIVGPSLISEITNLISNGLETSININKILTIGLILGSLYILSFILNYFSSFFMASTTKYISRNLRKDISRKINYLPLSYLDGHSHGDVLSRITNDVDTISQSLDQSLITLITSSILFIATLIIMFVQNWILALCSIGASIVGFILTALIMKFSQKHFMGIQKNLGELNGHNEEIFSGHNIVKAYNAEKQAIEKFNTINKNFYKSAWKAQFLSGLMGPIMNFVGNFSFVVICVVGGILIINGTSDIGTIAAFVLYNRYFTQSLNQLSQLTTSIQSLAAASERVFDILNQPELEDETNKTKQIENCLGQVEFKNVSFGYTKEKTIIKDFSVFVKPGQKVAIVGPTGAGKTTLVNLLMRFYEIDSGEILIDNINIKDITRQNLHDQFAMVLQDTWLFNGTIKENIIYNLENVSDEEVYTACKMAGIHHFIKTLPNGYETILNENTTISAGQKQLLTIARAMIQNNQILILDEATSSVDTRLELVIQNAMDELTKNRTSFVIAHRLSTIKNADTILVMKDGNVIESGNHNELIEKNGFYADLYNSQFSEN